MFSRRIFALDGHLDRRARRHGAAGLLRTGRRRPAATDLRGHQDRRGVEEAADARAVLRAAQARHRARRHQPARQANMAPASMPAPAASCRCSPPTTKFNSGTGWPSFYKPLDNAVGTTTDRSLVHDAHRGALPALRRPPGPRVRRRAEADRPALLHERRGAEVHRPRRSPRPEAGRNRWKALHHARRSLRLGRWLAPLALVAGIGAAAAQTAPRQDRDVAVAIFAGGCFWCVEEAFEKVPGVITAVSGYTGGTVGQSDLRAGVVQGAPATAEAVQVTYDPAKVSYQQLVDWFWHNIDPFDAKRPVLRQGQPLPHAPSSITTRRRRRSPRREAGAGGAQGPLQGDDRHQDSCRPAAFYPAEDYHQDYYKKNPFRYQYYKTAAVARSGWSRSGASPRRLRVWRRSSSLLAQWGQTRSAQHIRFHRCVRTV